MSTQIMKLLFPATQEPQISLTLLDSESFVRVIDSYQVNIQWVQRWLSVINGFKICIKLSNLLQRGTADFNFHQLTFAEIF